MKRIFTFLALFAVALVVSPRQSHAQQYAWVPIVSNEPIGTATQPTQPSTPQSTGAPADFASSEHGFATYIGDLAPDDGDGSCSKGGDCQCVSCRNSEKISRLFGGAEYLHWWGKGRNLPPLVTGGPPGPGQGVLPGAPILFGGGMVGEDLKSGLRAHIGMWVDDCQTNAVVVRAFGYGGDRTAYNQSGNGLGPNVLAVPFNDSFTGSPGSLVADQPGAAGSIFAEASNEILGGDAYFRTLVGQGDSYRLDLLGGYQMTRIDDDLVLNTVTTLNAATTNDLFNVSNEFHGAEFGLLGEIYQDCVTVQFLGKCGVGNMRQTVDITGSSTFNGPTTGGLFARPSNTGLYRRDRVSWTPEASVKLIAAIRENISVTVGYTFMYWTNVALAGDQVNTLVNSQALFNGGGTDVTTFSFNNTDYWVQTIDIGLSVGY